MHLAVVIGAQRNQIGVTIWSLILEMDHVMRLKVFAAALLQESLSSAVFANAVGAAEDFRPQRLISDIYIACCDGTGCWLCIEIVECVESRYTYIPEKSTLELVTIKDLFQIRPRHFISKRIETIQAGTNLDEIFCGKRVILGSREDSLSLLR